jgi:hypothetical protein
VSEKKVAALIKQGERLEDIARQCGCTVNYVVCTKREIAKGMKRHKEGNDNAQLDDKKRKAISPRKRKRNHLGG